MNNKTAFIMLFAFALSACGGNIKSIQPTNTQIPTETLAPTIAPTATEVPPTATPTEVPIPDYMSDFIARGYDQQPISGNEMHLVLKENEFQYPSNNSGLLYKGISILSWEPVEYIEKSILVKKIILGAVCKQTVNGRFMIYSLGNFEPTIIDGCPTVTAIKASDSRIKEFTGGDYPIIKVFDTWKVQASLTGIFDGVFPDETSEELTTVNIPGIGEVVVAQHIEYVDPPVK